MTVKVSVIIPVYNTEDYLGECLDSILTQTLEDIEIICVNDGSKDDSLSILQTYSFLDSRLKLVASEHMGAFAARNKGLAEAKGEYIYFANSYDLFDENMLEKMVQKAQTDKSDVVIDGYSLLDQTFKEISRKEKFDQKLLAQSPCSPQDFSDELFSLFSSVIWNKLIRSELIKKYHLQFDESIKFCEDRVFNSMILAGSTSISLMNECLLCHRINLNPYRKKDELKEFEDNVKLFTRLFHQMEKFGLFQEFDIPYYYELENFIWENLDNLATDKRGTGVKLILKYLPDKILTHIISPSKYEQKISIIIPVYNAAEFLPECLDSCLNQTLREIEIICVDDGSTDNSLDILNEYAQKDSRIKVLSQENQGRTIARNRAMEEAKGTYIQFLDADDYLEFDACEMLYSYARIFSLDMLSFAAVEFKDKTKEEFEDSYHNLSWLPERFPPIVLWKDITTGMANLSVTACLTIYRRMFLLKNNISWMNKKVTFEDTPFFTEAAFNNARMGTLKMPLYHRRVHTNATTQQMSKYFHDLIFSYKYTLKMLQDMNIPKEIVKSYADVFFNKVYSNFLCFELKDKEKETTTFYNFCLYMLKKYHLQFSLGLSNWINMYLKHKKLKKKVKFKYYWLCSKLIKDNYAISLFEFKKFPDFSIRIFSIPLLEIQVKKQKLYSMTCKIFGCHFISIKEIQEN